MCVSECDVKTSRRPLLQTVYSFFFKDVQQKVKPYLLSIDMSSFKYDDFLRVLNVVNQYVCMIIFALVHENYYNYLFIRLIVIGHQFCGEGSNSLEESMRQQSLKYFRSFHW